MTTLKVTVGERSRLDDRTRRRIQAAQRGEALDDVQPVLNFGSYAELSRLLSERNLELLEAIVTHDPESIRETADVVGRDYKQVHRNLTELAEIGIIDWEDEGPGRPKKPVMAYDGLEIDIPLDSTEEGLDTAAP